MRRRNKNEDEEWKAEKGKGERGVKEKGIKTKFLHVAVCLNGNA